MNKLKLAAALIVVAALTVSTVGPAMALNHEPGCGKSKGQPNKCEVLPPGGGEEEEEEGGEEEKSPQPRDSINYETDPSGVSPIATYLQSDGGKRFGTRWQDYDIATELVLWVVGQDSSSPSPVSVLTEGTVALTMFVPTDAAFRTMVRNLTGENLNSEKAVFDAITDLGFIAVEKVLLYHVVLKSDNPDSNLMGMNGRTLITAEGSPLLVARTKSRITLLHTNSDMKTPVVGSKRMNLNTGNLQIGHGINRVLMP